MMKHCLAISINGGGALGIGPLAFMCRLESDVGKKLSDISVAFAGTSTGAIIAGGLDEGYSAQELFNLYRDNLKKIFTKYSWYKRLQPSCPTYDNSNLKKILASTFKGKVCEWKKPIYIPTTHTNGESVEKVWDLGDKTIDKATAILTSTAAPTYFDCVKIGKDNYIDGGMWKNDPIDVLNAGLKRSEYRDNIRILSFNTGMDTPNTLTGNQSLIGWASYIFDEWVARAGKSGAYEVKADLGDENVALASPKNGHKIKMDHTDNETLDKIIKIWENYYDANREYFKRFVKGC